MIRSETRIPWGAKGGSPALCEKSHPQTFSTEPCALGEPTSSWSWTTLPSSSRRRQARMPPGVSPPYSTILRG